MVDIHGMDINCGTHDVDISQLCRLCATEDNNFVPIFEGLGLELELEIKLQEYLSLKVSKSDELPHHICMKCSNTLICWHDLVIGCKKAEERLLSLLSDKRVRSNVDEDVILVNEDSQDSVEIIESHDQPSSKPQTDCSDLRNSLRAKLGKLLHGPSKGNDATEGNQNTSPDRGRKVRSSTNTAGRQHSAKAHGPQFLVHSQTQPTAIVGTTQSPFSQNSNNAVTQPHFGLLAVGPSLSTSSEGTALVSPGLANDIPVSIQPNAGQLILDQFQPTSAGGTVLLSNYLEGGNALITQTSAGQVIFNRPPTGNLVQAVNNQAENTINIQSVVQPITGTITLSQSIPSSVVEHPVPTSGRKFKTIVKKVLLSRPESASASKAHLDSQENTDLVALLIPQNPSNTDPLSSTDSGAKSPVIAVPVILSRKPTRHGPSPSGGENAVLVQNSNLEVDSQESSYYLINKDALDLVDIGRGDDSRGPSPCRDTFTQSTLQEIVQVEAASGGPAAQSKIFQEKVIFRADISGSAATDPLHVSSYGDHRYSKPVNAIKESAGHKTKDDAGTKRCLLSAVPRKTVNKCFVCDKMIHNRTLLYSHEKSHFRTLGSYSLNCRLCTKSFKTFDEMVSHRRKHKKEEEDISSLRGKLQNVEEIERGEEVFEPHPSDDISFADDDFRTSEIAGGDEGHAQDSKVKSKSSKKNPKKTSLGMKCTMCGLYFKKKVELNEHKLSHSEEERAKPYPCKICDKRFSASHSLSLHHQVHSNVNELCPHCGKVFKQRSSLNWHIRKIHKDPSRLPSYQCELCPKKFHFPRQLMIHSNYHTGERPYICDKCGKSFRTPATFQQHQACHEDARPRKCKVCGKGFKWTKNLIQHSMTHVSKHLRPVNHVTKRYATKSLPCKWCGKILYNSSTLKLHMFRKHRDVFLLEHPEEAKLMCQFCSRLFVTQTSLDSHLEQSHAISQNGFSCDFCPKRFTLKDRRDAHARSHTGERPYPCEQCGKAFSCSTNLRAHLVSHSEVRRYSCTYCDKQFKKRAHLNVHVRIHTGEKPYECDVCGRRFIQSCEKNKHRGTHFGGRPFECTICESFFKKKKELVDHMAQHHVDERPQDEYGADIEIDYSAILQSDCEDIHL